MGFVELVDAGDAFPGGRTLFDKVSFKVRDCPLLRMVPDVLSRG